MHDALEYTMFRRTYHQHPTKNTNPKQLITNNHPKEIQSKKLARPPMVQVLEGSG